MVAVERWLDAERIHRSVWWCAFADSNPNSHTDAYSDTNAYADAGWRVTQ